MRLPNITSIRFFFALIVIFYHTLQFCNNRGFPIIDNLPFFYKGREAVYAFFVLSGFLIIRNLFEEKEKTGKINLKFFFINRAFRILPLYYLVLLIGFFYYRIFLPEIGINLVHDYNIWSGLALSLTLFTNVFSTNLPGGIIEILWSISIEEQFYLMIAPTLFLIPLKSIYKTLLFLTIVFVILYCNVSFFKKYDMLFFFFTIGGIFGLLIKKKEIQNILRKGRFLIFLITLTLFFTNFWNEKINIPELYLLFCALLFSIFISILIIKPVNFLENKNLDYLGKISYGLYVLHPISMQLIGFIFLKTNIMYCGKISFILYNLLVILLTTFFAIVSKKYFENYFMNLRSKFY